MNCKNLTVLPFVLLSFNGCLSFHAKPVLPEQTAAGFEARTLDDPGLRGFMEKNGRSSSVWPPPSWDISSLTLAAFYYNPDLDVARAQWDVAKAARVTAGERPNPTLSVNPEYAPNEPPDQSPWVVGVSLDIPFETAGKRGYRTKQSEALSDAARAHISRVAWLVRSRVRTSFLAYYAATQAETILQAQQKKLNENRELFERRSKGGWVSPLALTQAEVLAGKTDVAVDEARRLEIVAQGQLTDAIGITTQELVRVKISFDDLDKPVLLSPSDFTALRRQAMRTRSDLLEALANYAAFQHALQLEIAKQYPDIHLGPGYLFDQGISRWGLALIEALPIFNHNRGPIGEAAARREESAARFRALQDQVIGEIDHAIAGYSAAQNKYETAHRLLETHTKQDQSLQRLLHPGDLSRLTLFRAQLDIDSTRLITSDALVQFYLAEGALEDALERPLLGKAGAPVSAEGNPRSTQ